MASSTGLAHVASVSFLAARVSPAGSFWLSLAGGSALAREAEVRGPRAGYAGSIAAMLQTVAMVGPLRFKAPLTQAMSAPLLGWMQARRAGLAAQFLACLAIRLLHYSAITLFGVFVLLGTQAYAGGYRRLFGWIPFLPHGLAGALILTAIANVAFAIFFSIVQVQFYRQALAGWSARAVEAPHALAAPASVRPALSRTDPRIALLAATVVTGVLLASHAWAVLAAAGAWLAGALFVARGADRSVLRTGTSISLIAAGGTLAATLIGGLGAAEAASRSLRVALLVMVATWMRLAAGSAGLRETFRRVLMRLRRVPGAYQAGELLSELDSGPHLISAARRLADDLGAVPRSITPIARAVMTWAAREAGSIPVHEPAEVAQLRLRVRDAVFALSALLPAAALSSVF
jgi:hypothetical protein